MIRFRGINFRACSEILENSKIYCPQNFPAYGRYIQISFKSARFYSYLLL